MGDLVPAGVEQLGNEAAVTPRPERLRAHEARLGLCESCRECLLPLRCRHPRRVAAERGNADAREPLLPRLAAAPTAELDGVAIVDARLVDGGRESGLVELRMPPRTREAPHVDECLHSGFGQHLEELLDRPRAVPDRENAHLRRMPPWPTTSFTSPISSGRSGLVTRARSRGMPPR